MHILEPLIESSLNPNGNALLSINNKIKIKNAKFSSGVLVLGQIKLFKVMILRISMFSFLKIKRYAILLEWLKVYKSNQHPSFYKTKL